MATWSNAKDAIFFGPLAPAWALLGAPPFKVAMLLSGGPPSKLPIHHLTRG